MADKKISQLNAASTPLAGTEVLPIVQSGSTVKVSSDDLTVKNVRSNATTGILQVVGPGTGTTRVMTTPNANFTAARTDAGQTFTGVNTFTSPKVITSIDDTNGNEAIKLTATASAVNEITVANAATGNGPTISATGDDTNIDVNITPKASGRVRIGPARFTSAGSGANFVSTGGNGLNVYGGGGTNQWDIYLNGANLRMGDNTGGGNLRVDANIELQGGNVIIGTSGNGINDGNNNELFKFTATASAVNELTVANAATGNGPNISATGGDTNININLTPKGALGNVANRGTSIVTLDSTGIYAVASFGKTGIADNVATQICKLTGDTSMFGYVEILYAIEDPGTDVYVGRHSFRMFWDGSALLNSIATENSSGSLTPSFTAAGSGNDFIISVTANTIAATYNANFTVRWHSYAVPLTAIAIQEA